MLASMTAFFALIALPIPQPTSALALTTTFCFACHAPGCPNSTFTVCRGTSGKTTILSSNGGVRLVQPIDNDRAFAVGVGGALVHPASPGNWGSVTSCADIHYDC